MGGLISSKSGLGGLNDYLDQGGDKLDDIGEETAAPASTSSTTKHPGGSAVLPAKYRLKIFISHKGPSVHSGHYVAHIRVPVGGENGQNDKESWVLFNDEKVVKADAESVRELKKLAYLYVFERV